MRENYILEIIALPVLTLNLFIEHLLKSKRMMRFLIEITIEALQYFF